MITQEQIALACALYTSGVTRTANVTAVLVRDFKPYWLDYSLAKGTIIVVPVYASTAGDLLMNGTIVDDCFPYDAAELLE